MDANIEHLLRYLVAHLECNTCHHKYIPDDFEVVNRGDYRLVVLMTCHHCHIQGLLVAIVREQKRVSGEARQAKIRDEMDLINADDVLNIHRFLESYTGDCITLLKDPSQSNIQGEEVNGRAGHLAEGDT